MTTFEEEIEQCAEDHSATLARILVHADESRTFIYFGDYDDQRWSNPRDHDGNVLRLVNESRDYEALDEADEEIEYVRGLADLLGHYSGPENAHMFPADEDEFAHRMHAAGNSGEEVVLAYIEEFRPDIVHYIHDWTVQGVSQSDWQTGWAYVTKADYESEGFGPQATPEGVAEQELDIYRRWFRGEVYFAKHIRPDGLEYAIGDEGGYYTGERTFEEESLGAILAGDDLKWIGQEFTDSPVIEELWT